MSTDFAPEKKSPPAPPEKIILVVDDDASVREMISRVLVEEGYRVLSAANGRDALSLVVERTIHLVLLDLNLPGQGGWDIFEVLKNNNPALPVIIITARPNQLFTALGVGVGALLEKPLDYPLLLRTIASFLVQAEGHQTSFHYAPPKRK